MTTIEQTPAALWRGARVRVLREGQGALEDWACCLYDDHRGDDAMQAAIKTVATGDAKMVEYGGEFGLPLVTVFRIALGRPAPDPDTIIQIRHILSAEDAAAALEGC